MTFPVDGEMAVNEVITRCVWEPAAETRALCSSWGWFSLCRLNSPSYSCGFRLQTICMWIQTHPHRQDVLIKYQMPFHRALPAELTLSQTWYVQDFQGNCSWARGCRTGGYWLMCICTRGGSCTWCTSLKNSFSSLTCPFVLSLCAVFK